MKCLFASIAVADVCKELQAAWVWPADATRGRRWRASVAVMLTHGSQCVHKSNVEWRAAGRAFLYERAWRCLERRDSAE